MSQEFENDVLIEQEKRVQIPRKYKVIIFNDDYTSMEFVTFILETVFYKTPIEANALMLDIHEKGSGIAGVFSREIAEVKVAMTMSLAKEYEYPLLCDMEEE